MSRQNINDETEVNTARNWDRNEKVSVDISWRTILETENGRKVMWDIISGICQTYGKDGSLEHAQLAKRSGMRSVGLDIEERCLLADPEMFHQMRQESIASRLDRMNKTTGETEHDD